MICHWKSGWPRYKHNHQGNVYSVLKLKLHPRAKGPTNNGFRNMKGVDVAGQGRKGSGQGVGLLGFKHRTCTTVAGVALSFHVMATTRPSRPCVIIHTSPSNTNLNGIFPVAIVQKANEALAALDVSVNGELTTF